MLTWCSTLISCRVELLLWSSSAVKYVISYQCMLRVHNERALQSRAFVNANADRDTFSNCVHTPPPSLCVETLILDILMTPAKTNKMCYIAGVIKVKLLLQLQSMYIFVAGSIFPGGSALVTTLRWRLWRQKSRVLVESLSMSAGTYSSLSVLCWRYRSRSRF